MSRRSIETPPAGALTWPSSEVPVPKAITGTPRGAQIRTTSWISAVSCAITTASGACDGSHVVVWACCSRTACAVTRWLPKSAAPDGPETPAPFLSSVMRLEPPWIDYNGHLNMAYYNVLFDRAIDELWLELGIGPGYMKQRHGSTFTAECHVRYLREIHLDD